MSFISTFALPTLIVDMSGFNRSFLAALFACSRCLFISLLLTVVLAAPIMAYCLAIERLDNRTPTPEDEATSQESSVPATDGSPGSCGFACVGPSEAARFRPWSGLSAMLP